jgi:hypothetical protein
MTDRELLELAAKAAGMEVIHDAADRGLWIHGVEDEWNPITDDGDALRLAVKLGMFMRQLVREIPRSEYVADPYAATRRAITRAAAEIGRTTT